MSDQKTIAWTRPLLMKLKKAYREAKNADKDQFTFEVSAGETVDLVTNYAKYLIQYLDSVLLWGNEPQKGKG